MNGWLERKPLPFCRSL